MLIKEYDEKNNIEWIDPNEEKYLYRIITWLESKTPLKIINRELKPQN
jgi:hypothetical protein